jgi:hypothetical protein
LADQYDFTESSNHDSGSFYQPKTSKQFPLSGGRDVMQNRPIILHNPAIIFIKRPVQWQHQENAKKGELYAKCELGTRSYPSF